MRHRKAASHFHYFTILAYCLIWTTSDLVYNKVSGSNKLQTISCRRAAATICPRPGLQVVTRYTSCTHMDRSPLLYVHVVLPVQPTKAAWWPWPLTSWHWKWCLTEHLAVHWVETQWKTLQRNCPNAYGLRSCRWLTKVATDLPLSAVLSIMPCSNRNQTRRNAKRIICPCNNTIHVRTNRTHANCAAAL